MSFGETTVYCFSPDLSFATDPTPKRTVKRRPTPQSIFAVHPSETTMPATAAVHTKALDIPTRTISWREIVPARIARRYQAPCEALFLDLAGEASHSLAALISSALLDHADLTLAAEAVGQMSDRALVVATLYPLLEHASAVVREGAIYGLARHPIAEQTRARFTRITRRDPSEGVRSAAAEALESSTR